MNKRFQSGDMNNSFGAMTEGLTTMAIIVMFAVAMAILLVLSIIAQFI